MRVSFIVIPCSLIDRTGGKYANQILYAVQKSDGIIIVFLVVLKCLFLFSATCLPSIFVILVSLLWGSVYLLINVI